MPEQRIIVNGINALTGEYLVGPMTVADAAARARGNGPPKALHSWLKQLAKRLSGRFFGVPADVDTFKLEETGWAIVFTPETPAAVRKALEPLMNLRKGQAGPGRFKELEYAPGESKDVWLAKFGAHGSDVDPDHVPYYVLLVGGPELIPFEFQYLLDVDYAVGRIAFDSPDDYSRYVQSVVRYEEAASVANAREVVYWAPRHNNDVATQLSADALIGPLSNGMPSAGAAAPVAPIAEKMQFRTRCLLGEGQATKGKLLEVLLARDRAMPSLLFTASHGVGGWPANDRRQRTCNGALLCQDWPGFGSITPAHYLTAAEVEGDARLGGLVAFIFACYGAGTPRLDPFLNEPGGGPVQVADQPFVSALAQRLLACGTLAVVGHIERAWSYSIQPDSVGPQLLPFRNFIRRVLAGERVGHATMDFSQRFATYSASLLSKLDPSLPAAMQPTDAELANTWIERNDAQNYVVIGDPAVRLRASELK